MSHTTLFCVQMAGHFWAHHLPGKTPQRLYLLNHPNEKGQDPFPWSGQGSKQQQGVEDSSMPGGMAPNGCRMVRAGGKANPLPIPPVLGGTGRVRRVEAKGKEELANEIAQHQI